VNSGFQPRDLDEVNHETIGGVEKKELGDGVGLVRVELSDLGREEATRRRMKRTSVL